MRNKMSFLIPIALIFNVSFAANASIKMWYARIETNLGSIDLELDTPHAPITVGNFVSNTQNGAYLNGLFYRAVTLDNQPNNQFKIEVVQGGSNETFPRPQPILLERTSVTGLKHKDGTISMGRTTPDSATTEFFICVGDQPELDFGGRRHPDGQGFAAFGQVTSGMDLVRRIQTMPSENQYLLEPVVINKISVQEIPFSK